jgi:hypothetical protein
MDWFERLTGFREGGYESTRSRLAIENGELVSRVNGKRHGVGRLEVASLRDLRQRARGVASPDRRTALRNVVGEARALHCDPSHAGALFQVASQFNLLEMAGPHACPEDGVTRYANDPTQGPACAIAAGAATIYRNYFHPVDGAEGQTRTRQIDGLLPIGQALSRALGRPPSSLWTMRNGYALCTPEGLADICKHLRGCDEAARDELRQLLCIGLHHDVEVTDLDGPPRHQVSQAFCSALPIGYTQIPKIAWEPFARLVLEASYEATLLAAHCDHAGGGSNKVFLTSVGGGVFGNDADWIDAAIERALGQVRHSGLDVTIVGYKALRPAHQALAARFAAGHSRN